MTPRLCVTLTRQQTEGGVTVSRCATVRGCDDVTLTCQPRRRGEVLPQSGPMGARMRATRTEEPKRTACNGWTAVWAEGVTSGEVPEGVEGVEGRFKRRSEPPPLRSEVPLHVPGKLT